MGYTAMAKFYNISIIPNAVPVTLFLTTNAIEGNKQSA